MHQISKLHARRIWLAAQRLDVRAPFGDDPDATRHAIEHLGYVQIDTINVIERCHHHILYTRIPAYQRSHLHRAQATEKTVFEYWTHALSYVPVRDFRFFVGAMKRQRAAPDHWFGPATRPELRRVLGLLRTEGALSIRDFDDEVLVEKEHPWASRKPSKRVLQHAFHAGEVTISARAGMLKTYELTDRHFGWQSPPKAATEPQILGYLLERALRAQGLVSVDSICYLDAGRKSAMRRLVEASVRRKDLVPVQITGAETVEHWAAPALLERDIHPDPELVHILSPFDPLVIQRKRLRLLFDYEHRFEAYLPKEKRQFGYFALPVLAGSEIVAVIDLKTDRQQRRLLVQHWTWTGRGTARAHKKHVEAELHRFGQFQLS